MKHAIMLALLSTTALRLQAYSASDFIDYCTQVQAQELGIPFGVAERLRYSESSNYRYAKAWEPATKSWSLGWWGLNTRWGHDFSVRFNSRQPVDPYDPVISTRVALRYLASLYWQTGDWTLAVYSYKGGQGETAWKVAQYVATGKPWEGMSE